MRRRETKFRTTIKYVYDPKSVEEGRRMHETMLVEIIARKIDEYMRAKCGDA